MSQNPDTHNLPVYTVGELSQALKRSVEERFARVSVRGEISGFKRAPSGHLYMTLKDSDAVLDGVCWRGAASKIGLDPEDGMEVIAQGRLTTYPGRSKYQIVIDRMELAGEGALLKLLEDRKRKLAVEGLFDPARKKPLPFLPGVVGVVTSPTGAVFRDILHRLEDRFARHVILWPVLVQGEGAAEQVATAIDGFNAISPGGPVPRPDVLIVGRGGGSLEDLWAFNEEVVVRAAAASHIPLISAVGHETDTTLIDYASDRRAPTPTAAAEMVVPVRRELMAQVLDDGARMTSAMNRWLAEREVRLDYLSRGLPKPQRAIEEMAQQLDDRLERWRNAMASVLERSSARAAEASARLVHPRQMIEAKSATLNAESRALDAAYRRALDGAVSRFERQAALLESLSYERVLDRGFSIITDTNGHLVSSVASATPGARLGLRFKDGEARAIVEGADDDGAPPLPRKPKAQKKASKTDDRQGSLL